ncbi:MAG: hypothetical protein ABIQ73_11635 [Acidimicrobiales bacterium]
MASIATLLAGLMLWYSAVRQPRARNAGDLGLVTVLGPTWWIAIGLVAASFIIEVSNVRPRGAILAAAIVGLIFTLHGTAVMLEEAPRFPTAWLHAGFAEHIAQTGHTVPDLDARMSWPGFFSGAAMASRAMGVEPQWFLKWAPVVQNLAFLIPLKAIANGQLFTPRARWLTLWIFVCANWVGQDYFSPQAFAFFLMLCSLAVVTRVFSVHDQPYSEAYRYPNWLLKKAVAVVNRLLRSPSWSRPTELDAIHTSELDRLAWLLTLTATVGAIVVSHQLTPIALIAGLIALVALGRITLRASVLLFAVMLLAWISWGALPYWRGHLDDIFGGVGNVQSSVGDNVGTRLQGSSGRLWVVRSRIAVAALVWIFAALSLLWRWRRGFQHLWLVALAAAPFGIVAAQSYGGEALLRIYLFTLPACSMLIAAYLAEKHPEKARVRLAGRLVVLAVILMALFPFARWGNERFEEVTSDEVKAIEWVYANVPEGSQLESVFWNIPWRYRGLVAYQYHENGGLIFVGPESTDKVLESADTDAWIVLTRAQEFYGITQLGLPSGWSSRLVEVLESSGRFRVAFRNGDSAIMCGTAGSCLSSEATRR